MFNRISFHLEFVEAGKYISRYIWELMFSSIFIIWTAPPRNEKQRRVLLLREKDISLRVKYFCYTRFFFRKWVYFFVPKSVRRPSLCLSVKFLVNISLAALTSWNFVSWLLCGSFLWCHGFVCNLGLWYFLIMLNIFVDEQVTWCRGYWVTFRVTLTLHDM